MLKHMAFIITSRRATLEILQLSIEDASRPKADGLVKFVDDLTVDAVLFQERNCATRHNCERDVHTPAFKKTDTNFFWKYEQCIF